MATIIARPHPLRTDCYSANVADGATLYGLLGDMPESVLSQVDGEVWGRDRWGETLPVGALVTLYSTPEGDDIGRAVALIAVAVLAAYTGGAAGGLASGAGWGAAGAGAVKAGVAAAVTLAGSLAVNALIPPKMPSATGGGQSPNVRQSITGTRNQMDPYGVVPRVYGNPRWYPKLATTPITEIAGDDQYLRMLLCLGYGPLEIDGARVGGNAPVMRGRPGRPVGDAIRIGQTSIDEYEDVDWEIGTPNKLTMPFPDIHEEAMGVALNAQGEPQADTWVPDGNSATRTTAPGTKEISIDLVFPQGFFCINDNGNRSSLDVEFKVEYREAGTTTWTVQDGNWLIGGDQGTKDTYRLNKRWSVLKGQYDVRVTRVRSRHGGVEAIYTDCQWSVLRSIQQGAAYTGDHVLMALRIRATDQLNGVVDQLNVKTQAVLRTYNGSSFFDEVTSNPAWAYLDAMTGAQVGRPVPDQQIDFAALREWAAFCDAQGLAYSWVHDGSETVLERARAVAAAGQASFSLQDGLFGVVRDDANAPVVQAVTPRNATGFNSSRTFKDLPHALRVKYIDPDTWSDAERIVYRDGYDASNATRFEDFETQGVASAAEAYHHGMYHFRQAILRPETYRVSMDWEHLAAVRGNRVRLAYDAIKVGLGWGRVKQFDGTTITLDESVQYTQQKPYGIRVRGAEGPQGTTPVTSLTVGETNELRISTPVDVQPGDLVLYGELDKESLDCKVTKIENGGDFTADLTLVPAATDIYNYSEAPAWDPGITNPIPTDQIRPPTPTITSLRGDESASQINPDGSYQTLIRVAYSLPAQRGLPSLEVEARYRIVGSQQWKKAGPFTASGNITIRDVNDGENYQVQVRAVNGMMYSPWSQTGTLAVTGQLISPPASIDVRRGTFTMTLLPQGLTQNQQWEFYRSQAPLAMGDVETAGTRLGIGATWTDTDLQPDTTYYYYVRGWSVAFTSAWYALEVKTRNDPSAVMGAISGEIKKGDLWPALEQEIDKIGSIGSDIDDIFVDVSGLQDRADAISDNLTQTQQELDSETARIDGRVDGVRSDLTSEANRLDGEINSVSSQLDAARSDLEQADTELSGRLDSAESAIVDERTDRETEQGFIVERLDGLVRDTGDNRASIGRLQRIQQEGDELDAIIFEALNVESGSRQASIRTEEQVRIDGDSALAQRSDALEASIGDNAARITTVDQARADGDSALSSQIGELSAKVNALPQFGSGFEAGADFDQWVVAGTDTLTVEAGDIYAGLQSALLTSTAANPSSGGNTGATYAAIPAGATDAFEGFEVTIRIAAKQPSANASAEFAVAYSTNAAGSSTWQRFTPTATWQTFEFSYTVPEGGTGSTDYIGIWADTSGAGNGILIDSVSVKRVAGEILEITAAIEQANQARADGDAALTQQLNALTTTVGDNTSSIQQESQTRADETTALAQQTTALRSDVDGNAAGITSVQQAVSDTESALSSRIDGISARAGNNETAINSERTARSDADSALSTRIDSVTATAGDNSAAITEEVRARADETSANAARISGLTLNSSQQKAAIQALERLRQEGTEIEAIQFESINVESASRSASVRTEEQARIEDGVAFASRMSSIETSVDDVDARVTSEASARSDADTALGTRIDTVTAEAGDNAAALQSESTARADADTALGTRIDTVQAETGDNAAAIQSESTARTNADTALGSRIDTVQAGVDDNSAAIQSEQNARVTADDALATDITTLQSNVGDNSAAIQTEQTARADADTALGSRIDTVVATAGDNSAAIQTEQTARADGDTALGSQISTVQAKIGDDIASTQESIETRLSGQSFVQDGDFSSGKIDYWAGSGVGIASVRPAEPGSNDQIVSTAPSGYFIELADSGHGGNKYLHNGAPVATCSPGDTISISMDYAIYSGGGGDIRMWPQWFGADGNIIDSSNLWERNPVVGEWVHMGPFEVTAPSGSVSCRIVVSRHGGSSGIFCFTNIRATRVDELVSEKISTVQSSLGDEIASVEQQTQASINEQTGRINAMWTLRTDVNGLVGGIGLANDGQQVDFAVRADRFSIAPPGLPNDAVIPFIVKGGTTYLSEARIESLTFTKLQDGDGELIVQNGKVKAEYIETSSLVVSSGNVSGLGSLATKNGVIYDEISGVKPPSNADETGSNTAYDTARVAGDGAADVRNKANNGNVAKARTDGWAYPGNATFIDGGKIRANEAWIRRAFIHSAAVDTLQINDQAVTVPVEARNGARTRRIPEGTWAEVLRIVSPGSGRCLVTASLAAAAYKSNPSIGSAESRVSVRFIVSGGDYLEMPALFKTSKKQQEDVAKGSGSVSFSFSTGVQATIIMQIKHDAPGHASVQASRRYMSASRFLR